MCSVKYQRTTKSGCRDIGNLKIRVCGKNVFPFTDFYFFVGYFNCQEGHNSFLESCEVPQQILTLTFIGSKVTKKPAARQAIYNSALYSSFED